MVTPQTLQVVQSVESVVIPLYIAIMFIRSLFYSTNSGPQGQCLIVCNCVYFCVFFRTGIPLMSLMVFFIQMNWSQDKSDQMPMEFGKCKYNYNILYSPSTSTILFFSFHSCALQPFTVLAGPLRHRVTTFGYVIMEDDIPGK